MIDNLNTHNLSSLYEAFDPETALNLTKRLEINYTPKHGSWLNIAESELSVMTRQCLVRRIADIAILGRELAERESKCNITQKGVGWQLTADDVSTKLKRLYTQFKI